MKVSSYAHRWIIDRLRFEVGLTADIDWEENYKSGYIDGINRAREILDEELNTPSCLPKNV